MMTVPAQTQKPRKGCLFYGCLTIAILSLAVLIGGGLGLYFLHQKVEAFVERWASTEPMELPEVGYTTTDMGYFKERLKIFSDGLATGKPTVPLTLKGEDLNMLLATSSELKLFSDGIRARVEGDEIRGLVSLRLGDLGAPFFQDRYINGEVAFKAELADGELVVRVTEVVVNGEPLPDNELAQLRKKNLAQNIVQDPDVKATLEKLESINVANGAIKVVPQVAE